MELLSLGREPVSPDQPTGSDVRYEPEFEELQAEVDKLSSPSATGDTDWKKVEKLSSEILANKSKDLLVASYLSVAQIYTSQIEGFAVGLGVYRGLLERFWDNLFPAKKRMRARVAAIEWWLEKSERALQLLKIDPVPTEKIEEYRQDLQQIDQLLQEYLEDAPLLRPLERFIDDIPIKGEKKLEPKASPLPEEQPQARPARPPEPDRPRPAPPAEAGEISLESDAERVLREALQTVRRVAEYFHDENLSDPRGYRWRRIAGWSMIQAIPPSTDGKTEIPLPLNHGTIKSDLVGLRDKDNWEALLRTAEERFQGALLWLDLNRFVAEALAGLGDQYQDAHDTVCHETAFLIHRLQGLEDLSFSDGTPFADAETKHWLRSIGFGARTLTAEAIPMIKSSSTAQDENHMSEAIQKAQALANKKKLVEAVNSLQQELRNSFSQRERLLWRLALSQILVSSKQPKLAVPHLEEILQYIETYRLGEWDPDLALKGLKIVWVGFDALSDQESKSKASDTLNQIAKLDPAEAIRLGKR